MGKITRKISFRIKWMVMSEKTDTPICGGAPNSIYDKGSYQEKSASDRLTTAGRIRPDKNLIQDGFEPAALFLR